MAYDYQSDTTQFLNELLEQNPQLTEERLRNRHILWDVNLNPDEQKAYRESHVAKKPYTYYQD